MNVNTAAYSFAKQLQHSFMENAMKAITKQEITPAEEIINQVEATMAAGGHNAEPAQVILALADAMSLKIMLSLPDPEVVEHFEHTVSSAVNVIYDNRQTYLDTVEKEVRLLSPIH
jgi:hypothetical protein